jgi:hypothetical protein
MLEEFRVHKNERPYSYYTAINPQVTRVMYNYLKGNGSLWKIECGREVKIRWSNEPPLKAVWFLDNEECYCNRFKNYYEDDNEENNN